MTTYKALVDLVVAGKGVKAGSTFTASDEQVAPALAFALVEVVDDKPKHAERKSPAKRSSGKE